MSHCCPPPARMLANERVSITWSAVQGHDHICAGTASRRPPCRVCMCLRLCDWPRLYAAMGEVGGTLLVWGQQRQQQQAAAAAAEEEEGEGEGEEKRATKRQQRTRLLSTYLRLGLKESARARPRAYVLGTMQIPTKRKTQESNKCQLASSQRLHRKTGLPRLAMTGEAQAIPETKSRCTSERSYLPAHRWGWIRRQSKMDRSTASVRCS